MSDISSPPDANLVEFLSSRARNTSDGRLALDAGLGFVVAIIALIWRPGGWHLIACIGVCFAAFGAWGIADRELRERAANAAPDVRLLRVGRAMAAVVGALAAALLLIGLLGLALGTWIS